MSSADNLIKMLESGIFTTTRADSDRAQIALKWTKVTNVILQWKKVQFRTFLQKSEHSLH